MTEAVSSPSNCSTPKWIRFRIGNLQTTKDGKFIRLISIPKDDEKQTNEEYPTFVDFSGYRISDVVEVLIEDNKVTGIRFPPGMEPVDTVPVVKGPPSAKEEFPKQDPIKEVTGDVSMLTDKGVKIGSNEMVFINNVALSGIKEGTRVKAKIQGNNLLHIEVAPVAPPVLRGGHGPIKELDLNKPYLSYEFSWKDKQTGELKSATQEFSNFTPEVKSKLSQFKIGEKIAVQFSGGGKTATLHEIGPDTKKGGPGWGGPARDPVEEAKRQKMIVRQSSLERAETLWINGNPGKEPTPEEEDKILTRAEKFEKWVMRE